MPRGGIKPIIGIEAYMAAESRHERPVRRGRIDDTGGEVERGEKLYYHLTLLAENDAGLQEPPQAVLGRVPRGLLLQAAGRTGSCWSATTRADRHHRLPRRRGRTRRCWPATRRGHEPRRRGCRRSSGRDNLFVELQDHGLEEQRKTNPQLVEIARRIGAPLLATNDSHYTTREDHVAHDALLCVQTGADASTTPSGSGSRARSTT